jgi:hypothetical protein
LIDSRSSFAMCCCANDRRPDDRRLFSLRRELCRIVNSQLLFYFCHIVRVNVEAIPAEGLAFDLFELLIEATQNANLERRQRRSKLRLCASSLIVP